MKLSLRHLPGDAIRVFAVNVAAPIDMAASRAVITVARKTTGVITKAFFNALDIPVDVSQMLDDLYAEVGSPDFMLRIDAELAENRFHFDSPDGMDRSVKAGLLYLADLAGLTPTAYELGLREGLKQFAISRDVTDKALGLDDEPLLSPEAFARWMETGEFPLDMAPIKALGLDDIKGFDTAPIRDLVEKPVKP